MLEISIIISLVVIFIHVCTWEGMLLSFVVKVFWHAPTLIKKPLFSCPVCMCPWWGSMIIIAFGLITGSWPHWYIWILEVMVAGGINAVIAPKEEEVECLK